MKVEIVRDVTYYYEGDYRLDVVEGTDEWPAKMFAYHMINHPTEGLLDDRCILLPAEVRDGRCYAHGDIDMPENLHALYKLFTMDGDNR